MADQSMRVAGFLHGFEHDRTHSRCPGSDECELWYDADRRAQGLASASLLPTEAETKALVETATRLGRELGRRESAEEIAKAFEPMLYNSPDGDAFEHTHPKWEGEPECPACWVQHIRQILAREIATKEPT